MVEVRRKRTKELRVMAMVVVEVGGSSYSSNMVTVIVELMEFKKNKGLLCMRYMMSLRCFCF